jgi:hypothetical protein
LVSIHEFEEDKESGEKVHVSCFIQEAEPELITSSVVKGRLIQDETTYNPSRGDMSPMLASFDKTESSLE